MGDTPKLRVDVWSDIACPWCFVGKRRLEAALEQFEHGDEVDVVWHAFELDPSAPSVLPAEPSYVERLATKYRCSPEQGQAMIDRMTQTAAAEGLAFRFDRSDRATRSTPTGSSTSPTSAASRTR